MYEKPSEITFSFVVPVFNAQDGLEGFYSRLVACAELREPYEVIFVDDGSVDETPAILRRLAADDVRVRVVEFSRSFGMQAAVTAGHDFARGRAAISLGADGRHPPESIGQLVARWREGFEVVHAVPTGGKGVPSGPPPRSPEGWAGRTVLRLPRRRASEFLLLDRKAVDALRAVREKARCVGDLVGWIGFRQTTVPYAGERPAAAGRFRAAAAATLNSCLRLLWIAPALGATMAAAAVGYAAVSLALWPFGAAPGPWAHVAMAVVGLSGLQLLLLWLLGQYVRRVLEEAGGRTLYVVRETIGFPQPSGRVESADEVHVEKRSQERFSVFT